MKNNSFKYTLILIDFIVNLFSLLTVNQFVMKKFITLICMGLFFISCSKDDNSSSSPILSNTPMAKAAYDSSNYGIYKGVFVGSTGNVLININNDGTISATVVIDGVTYNFTTIESVSENQYITGLTFTSGTMSFDFNVSADGSNPYVSSIIISGHPNSTIAVVKEDSEHLVKCYQGTYSGDATGTLNLCVIENEINGLAKPNDDIYSIRLEGEVINNQVNGHFEGGTFSGTVNGNNISGTWQNIESENGTWTGTRTL